MEMNVLPWKTIISNRLKERNREHHAYDPIIENYTHLWESRESLQQQCRKLEQDLNHLRMANAGLERASLNSQETIDAQNELKNLKEELVAHLRDKSDLAREVVQWTRKCEEINEKYLKEEAKARQYQLENEELRLNLKNMEAEFMAVSHIKEILQEEFDSLKGQLEKLQLEYNEMKPGYLILQQQLQAAEKQNKHLEDEVIYHKNRQAEMYDLENQRSNHVLRRIDTTKSVQPGIFIDDDMVVITADQCGNAMISSPSESELVSPSRRNRGRNPLEGARGGLFNSFIRKLTNGTSIEQNDRISRPTMSCISASLPNNEATLWDCSELEVYSLQFQPFGSLLATGSSDKVIRLWEISSTGHQHKYCTLSGSDGSINAIDFANEGDRLILGCSGAKAYLWSYGNRTALREWYNGHENLIHSCKFLPGSKFVTGSADRTIKIWDLTTKQCIGTFLAGSKCHDIAVVDATGIFISGHYDRKIRVWDQQNSGPVVVLEYDASITSLAYSNDRQQLLACFKNDTLRLIDVRQTKVLSTFSDEHFKVSNETSKAIFSPDGQYICAGSHDGSVLVWNADQQTCSRVLKRGHSTMVTGVAWHPEGRFLASCEKQRRVVIWSD